MANIMNHNEKKDYIEVLSEMFERIGGWSYDNRWIVLLISLIAWGISGYLATKTRVDMSFESFFNEGDPTYGAYLKYRNDFGSDEISYILYKAPKYPHGPWNIEVMHKINQLTTALEEEVPFVKEVKTLTNVEFMEGIPDGIHVYELLEEFPKTQKELLEIRDKVLARPIYVGGFVSKDAEFAAIVIDMEISSIDPPEALIPYQKNDDDIFEDIQGQDIQEQDKITPEKEIQNYTMEEVYPQVTDAAIEKILSRPEYKGIEFFHAGDVPLNSAYNRIIASESLVLMGICFLVIMILLFIIFRTVIGVIGPFFVVAVSIGLSVGFMGILGWRIDFMFALLPTLLIAVGVADSVHIISEFYTNFGKLGDRRKAICRTLYLVGPPCLLTSFTTAAGFCAMSISQIKSLAHFAVYSAFGVIAAFLFSVTLLVIFLTFGKKTCEIKKDDETGKKPGLSSLLKVPLTWIANFDVRYRKMILLFFAGIFIVSGFGITKLTVDSNFLDELSDEVPIREITLYVDEVMGGTSSVVYLFDTGVAEGIKEPAVLREIERLQTEADKYKTIVKKTYSIVDIIKDINMSFHNGDPEYYKIPDTRNLVAQYLLIYEMSGGDDVGEFVSGDFSRATLELRCKMVETSRLAVMIESLQKYLEKNPVKTSTINVTGIGTLWLKFAEYITTSQIQGILLAFTVIALLMCFIFRSVKIGLLAMVPNVSPVILVIGFMGWYGLPLDYVRLLIATIAIGIAVDDTIHHVTRFHLEFLTCRNYKQALVSSMQDVGKPLFITSLILILGFMVNYFSIMDSLVSFGFLLAGTILAALIADFLLMPALVLTFKPFGEEE